MRPLPLRGGGKPFGMAMPFVGGCIPFGIGGIPCPFLAGISDGCAENGAREDICNVTEGRFIVLAAVRFSRFDGYLMFSLRRTMAASLARNRCDSASSVRMRRLKKRRMH